MSGSWHDYFGGETSKLKDVRIAELATRFGFGAAVSLVAGTIGLLAGARAGGMFLAFPAILPAALTIIEKKEGRRQALEDERGSSFGAAGLVVFAVVSALTILSLTAVATLVVALIAWAVSSVTFYLTSEILRRRRRASADAHPLR